MVGFTDHARSGLAWNVVGKADNAGWLSVSFPNLPEPSLLSRERAFEKTKPSGLA
ncbi:hypothetical protein D3C83_142810 [compost metagenome]